MCDPTSPSHVTLISAPVEAATGELLSRVLLGFGLRLYGLQAGGFWDLVGLLCV